MTSSSTGLYITNTGVNISGAGLAVTGSCSALSLSVTANGINSIGPLTGSSFTNLLSPYALITSLSSYVLTSSLIAYSVSASSPLLAISDGVNTNISFNSSKSISCNGLTSTSGINVTGASSINGNLTLSSGGLIVSTGGANFSGGLIVTIGGLSITGNSSISGNLSVSSGSSTFAVPGVSNSMTYSYSNSTLSINPTSLSNVGLSCQTSGFYGGQNWIRIIQGSSGSIVCQSWNSSMTFTAGSSSWTAASDERLKDITGTYDNALQDINKIKPIKFTWKQHPEDGAQVGVIAQSVLDANIPEAVSNITYTTDGNEYLGVRYTELIPICIASIQELGSKLQAALDRITVLETQLASK